MKAGNRDYDPCVKVSLELESLLQHHFQQRQHSKRILKDRLRKAELEIAHLQQSVSAYSEELRVERLKFDTLQRTMEDAKRNHAAELMEQERLIRDRMCNVDTQTKLLVVKTEECERRVQCLQKQEEELLNREKELKFYQASFEAGIMPAQRQIEAERVRMLRAREKAEQLLEEAKISALATEERRKKLEALHNLEMRFFALEKEEATQRIQIMRQEILGLVGLISFRRAHVSAAEGEAAKRIRLLEEELASKKEVFELREKEVYLRYQREEQRMREERERIISIKEAMRQDYRLVLEGIRLFGNEYSTEPDQLQVEALKDLEKLLFSALDDHQLEITKKL
ncbi:hypothetical protein BCY84_19580 [Trypanosoma cruzi cruzi]|nr:Basal body protein [Trypanosoma cruzi]PBJ69507.1 hypothetical protein BCY84_19580 [Trypanosoma cruzi cruzi]